MYLRPPAVVVWQKPHAVVANGFGLGEVAETEAK